MTPNSTNNPKTYTNICTIVLPAPSSQYLDMEPKLDKHLTSNIRPLDQEQKQWVIKQANQSREYPATALRTCNWVLVSKSNSEISADAAAEAHGDTHAYDGCFVGVYDQLSLPTLLLSAPLFISRCIELVYYV